MKEFLNKHPIISFLALDTIVCGIANIANNILRYRQNSKIIATSSNSEVLEKMICDAEEKEES